MSRSVAFDESASNNRWALTLAAQDPSGPKMHSSPMYDEDESGQESESFDGSNHDNEESQGSIPDSDHPRYSRDGRPRPRPKREPISYSVDFKNSEGRKLVSLDWASLFDLADVRQQDSDHHYAVDEDVLVFHVITSVDTSLRSLRRGEKLLESLKSPDVLISIRSKRIRITSPPLIRALRVTIGFYPSVDLTGDVVDLEEPWPMLGHYLETLEEFRTTYSALVPHVDDTSAPSEGRERSPCSQFRRRCTKIESEHLGLLLDFAKRTLYRDDIEVERDRHSRNVCTYRMLWLLFEPGEVVYLRKKGAISASIVSSVTTRHPSRSDPRSSFLHSVNIWSLKYDGRWVGRCSTAIDISPFSGEVSITSLKLFPSRFLDHLDSGNTREALETRGRTWYELLRGGQVHYSGPTNGSFQRKCEGRVYVDCEFYHTKNKQSGPINVEIHDKPREQAQSNRTGGYVDRIDESDTDDTAFDGFPPHEYAGAFVESPDSAPFTFDKRNVLRLPVCYCEECRGIQPHKLTENPFALYDRLDPKTQRDLTVVSPTVYGPNHRYLLCDSELFGFVLKSKTWEVLDATYCSQPKNNTQAIDMLVMPPERKHMIKALIQKFKGPDEAGRPAAKPWAADFIDNKGEGQIILLHGSPGVGKTYTAECIAEYTSRPLLSLTCGDIGTDETRVEQELSHWFHLAERWGAVMLLDEADAYLETRLTSDIKRNALVSVFLRCMEYYQGILFLTTNRVGQFDDAFMSRIHVTIKYDRLSNEYCKTIWRQFFNKLSDERQDFVVTKRAKTYVLDDENITRMRWNGREIRNCFQTAVTLAEYRFSRKQNKTEEDSPTLDERDFEEVCNMTMLFKDYLTDVHGEDEENRAFVARTRAGYNDSHDATRATGM